jgi:L-ornithine N5-monooxygenase
VYLDRHRLTLVTVTREPAISLKAEHREVELLGVGAGPSNLALAVALEELGPPELARGALLIEQGDRVAWHPGMLLPEAQSQVSFLKDLVTLRNPRSRFSFVNYLHAAGRLDEFVNLGTFFPYRREISDYLQWVARSLANVRVEYGRTCVGIEPLRRADGTVTGWLARLAGGATIACRYLVFGGGRAPYVPPVFAGLAPERVIHSTRYLPAVRRLAREAPQRVAVVGGAQSAAEMFHAVQQDLPGCSATMIMRSIGLNAYENSRFTNELFFPSFVDEFFGAPAPARTQLLREMHRTNYSGLAPALLETLYRKVYLDRLTGRGRLCIRTMTDIVAAKVDGADIVLELRDRKTGAVERAAFDVVLLGTGFAREMPAAVRALADALGLGAIEVTRDYRLKLDAPADAACYLQGVNEATHGIADSLMSVLAHRASEITDDIRRHRAAHAPVAPPAALAA